MCSVIINGRLPSDTKREAGCDPVTPKGKPIWFGCITELDGFGLFVIDVGAASTLEIV